MEIKTTHEIIKPCIEYKSIIFTNHWTNYKNKTWIAVDDLIELLDRLDNSKGWEIREVIKQTLSKSTEQKSSKCNNNFIQFLKKNKK